MNIFFTGDHHFGHTNIIKYCERPFSGVTEMDEKMVEEWNAVVGSGDLIYHLGDFTFGGGVVAEHYFNQLNGQIYVLSNWWHHDARWLPCEVGYAQIESKSNERVITTEPLIVLDQGWTGWDYWEGAEQPPLVLCHYPFAVWDRRHYGSIHLHAHSHGKHKGDGKILDVGVDSAYKLFGRYAPFSLRQIMDYSERN